MVHPFVVDPVPSTLVRLRGCTDDEHYGFPINAVHPHRAAIALVIVRFALIVIPMSTPFIAMNRSIAYGKIVR